MKSFVHYFKTPRLISFFILVSIIFSMSSCAKKLTFRVSSVTPAATGEVKIKKDENKNYRIDVSLKNLAPSDRLTPPKANYIVWVETDSNGVKNIGQINTSGKNLKASLEAHIPFEPKNVFITAEDAQNVQSPGNTIVLTTK